MLLLVDSEYLVLLLLVVLSQVVVLLLVVVELGLAHVTVHSVTTIPEGAGFTLLFFRFRQVLVLVVLQLKGLVALYAHDSIRRVVGPGTHSTLL